VVATVDLTEGTGVELVDGGEPSPPVQPATVAATTRNPMRTRLAILTPIEGVHLSGQNGVRLSRDEWPPSVVKKPSDAIYPEEWLSCR
jgi:hypothetical protein